MRLAILLSFAFAFGCATSHHNHVDHESEIEKSTRRTKITPGMVTFVSSKELREIE